VDSSGLYVHASPVIVSRMRHDPLGGSGGLDTFRTQVRFYPSQEKLEQALRSGEVPQGMVIPADYLAHGRLRHYLRSRQILSSSSTTDVVEPWLARNLVAGQTDSLHAERASRPAAQSKVYTLGRDDRFTTRDEQGELAEFLVPFLLAMLLAMCIMVSGQYLLQGLSEEKESRILESLLCTLSPEDLLAGKLLGLGAAGLTLVAVWMGAGMAFGGPALALAQAHLRPYVLVIAVLYFLLGYLFYGSFMTAIGAVASNMREAQQFSVMLSILNVVPAIILPRFLDHPDGALPVALSLIPPTAPTAMMLRLGLTGTVPLWQLAASFGLLAISTWLVLQGAVRVFRIALLMVGKTPNLPEILRWARAGR